MQEFEQEAFREAKNGVVVVIRGVGRLTPKALRLALRAAIGAIKLTGKAAMLPVKTVGAIADEIQEMKNAEHHGKQTVKQLARKDKGLQSIEVNKDTIGDFNRVARKYGVDFAPYKVKGERTYMVFFKAQDADALTAAFKEYTAKEARKAARPSLRQQLAKLMPVKSPAHERGSRPEPVR